MKGVLFLGKHLKEFNFEEKINISFTEEDKQSVLGKINEIENKRNKKKYYLQNALTLAFSAGLIIFGFTFISNNIEGTKENAGEPNNTENELFLNQNGEESIEVLGTEDDDDKKKDEIKKKIQKLEAEVQQVKTLQQADNRSRVIMLLIANGKFEELKKEFNVLFEVKDGAIDFGVPDSNTPFRIDLARHPMFISSFNNHYEATEISYYIDNLETEERTLITMHFDKDDTFKYIFVGDR